MAKNQSSNFYGELSQRKDKNSRIQLNEINDYIEILSQYGTQIGETYINILMGIYGN